MSGADGSTRVFAALADPTRRYLLERIVRRGPLTATRLAEGCDMTRQAVSKHLGTLADAGLVTVKQVGRERHYSFDRAELAAPMEWLAGIEAAWDARLDALRRLVEEPQKKQH